MNKQRRLKRRLEELTGGRSHAPPRKEDASRYQPSEKIRNSPRHIGDGKPVRGPKVRGPATRCWKCGAFFFSKKQRSQHLQLSHTKGEPDAPTGEGTERQVA